MTNIHQKREYVANMYPNQVWKNRVKAMSDTRVIAIYLDAIQREEPKPETKTPVFKQGRLF